MSSFEADIEADIAAAVSALGGGGRVGSPPGAPGGAAPRVTDARRKEILAQLASERAVRRGYASEREQELLREAPGGGGGVGENATSGQLSGFSTAAATGAGVRAAVELATSRAVSSAVAKAFASVGLTVPSETLRQRSPGRSVSSSGGIGGGGFAATGDPSAWPGAADVSRDALGGGSSGGATLAQGGGSREVAPPPTALPPPPASLPPQTPAALSPSAIVNAVASRGSSAIDAGRGSGNTARKGERDALVANLLAQRRAKLTGEGRASTAAAAAAAASAASGAVVRASAAFSAAIESALARSREGGEGSGPGRPMALDARAQQFPSPQFRSRAGALQAPALVAAALEARAAAKAPSPPSVASPTAATSATISALASSSLDNGAVLRALRAQVAQRLHSRGITSDVAMPGAEGGASSGGGAHGGGGARSVSFASPPQSRERDASAPTVAQQPPTMRSALLEKRQPAAPVAETPTRQLSPSGFTRPTLEDARAAREAHLFGECSFQPNVTRRSVSPKAVPAGRWEQLAVAKTRVWAAREREKAEVEAAQVAALCSFQPGTAPPASGDGGSAPRSRSRSRSPGGGGPTGAWGQAQAYLAPASVGGRAASSAAADGLFSGTAPPGGGPSAAMGEPRRAPAPAPPVVSRLFGEADRRALKHAQAKAAVERQAQAAHTFHPIINPASVALLQQRSAASAATGVAPGDAGVPRPLHERAEDVARSSAEALHRLRLEAALAGPAAECTFQPRINAHSARLADGSARGRARKGGSIAAVVTDRLTLDGVEAGQRKAALRVAAAAEEAARHPFAPQVASRRTDALVRARLEKLGSSGAAPSAAAVLEGELPRADDPGARFLARQTALLEAQAAHRAASAAALDPAEACTFTPDIGNADAVLAAARPERVAEAQAGAAERLSHAEGAARDAAIAAAQEAFYAQFSFKPAISAASRALGTAHTVDELLGNEKGARVRLRAAALAEAEFRAKHPFQPVLVAGDPVPAPEGSSAAASARAPPLRLAVASDPEHVTERIAEHAAASAAALEAARRRAEYEELKACTFAPQTAASQASLARAKAAVEADGGVVVVHGLGRHLELKELTRRMEEEKRCVGLALGFFWTATFFQKRVVIPLHPLTTPLPAPLQRARDRGLLCQRCCWAVGWLHRPSALSLRH